MIEYRIKINKEILATFFMGGDKGTVIFASGLPQYVQKQHSFVSQIVEAGYSLCIPKYYGTWESLGDFSLDTSTQTLEETVDFVKKGECEELFSGGIIKWNTNKIILMGYSFGALPTLQCKADDVFATLLVCPFISSSLQSEGEDINNTLEFIKKAYPNVYRFNLEKFLEDLKDPFLPNIKNKLIIIKGMFDKVIPDETYNFLSSKYKIEPIVEDIGHTVMFKESYFS